MSPLLRAEDEFAEILVLGEQRRLFFTRPLQHLRIDSSGTRSATYSTSCPAARKRRTSAGVDAFIREPAHIAGSVVNDFLVGEIVSRERLRGANIL